MTDPLAVLRAGLDGDERQAIELCPGRKAANGKWRADSLALVAMGDPKAADFVARHSPRDVLRWLSAVRKVLEVCDRIEAASLDGSWWEGHYGDRADDIREALAGIYDDGDDDE